jgi:uncharacterized membrane protein YdbT with pleckstrin-like domain
MLAERIQLEHDEVILAQVRKHWFMLLLQVVSVSIGALFPLGLYVLFTATPFSTVITVTGYGPLLISLYAGWLILSWMTLFGVWTNYYLDIWTVTNKRLITVDQRGLFNRATGSFRLERLQDINVSVRGILATFLKFGDLQAETASEDRDFVARGIPDPQELKALILKASDSVSFTSTPRQNSGTEV